MAAADIDGARFAAFRAVRFVGRPAVFGDGTCELELGAHYALFVVSKTGKGHVLGKIGGGNFEPLGVRKNRFCDARWNGIFEFDQGDIRIDGAVIVIGTPPVRAELTIGKAAVVVNLARA